MSDSEDILRKLRALKPALKDWKIKRLRVFGSVLHGTAGPGSDIDLIVDFEKKPSYFGFLDLREEITDKMGRKIDLFTEDSIHKYIKPRVLKEARDVWEG
jgi:uncharacterized protein